MSTIRPDFEELPRDPVADQKRVADPHNAVEVSKARDNGADRLSLKIDREQGTGYFRRKIVAHPLAEGPRWDDFDEGIAAISEVGPGGHYLGHPHTLENFQRAFFMPDMFDNNSIEQWQAEGSVEITERALKRARKLLSEYQEPKLDEATDEALLAYIAKREREIPEAEALNQDY